MAFVSLLIALMLEQVRPLRPDSSVRRLAAAVASEVERLVNAGSARHGLVAWLVIAAGSALLVWVASVLLGAVSPLFSLLIHIAILYLTIGFRQFSFRFGEIQEALNAGDLDQARSALNAWLEDRGQPAVRESIDAREVARLTMRLALVDAHRRVFGGLFWFAVLPGPAGALLYRISEHLARAWSGPDQRAFGLWPRRIFAALDQMAAYLTASAFAIVGNFEDAVFCWRQLPKQPGDDGSRLVLASAAGALGVRLDLGAADPDAAAEWSPVEPDVPQLRSAVGLVWRAVVLALGLLGVLWVAGWLS